MARHGLFELSTQSIGLCITGTGVLNAVNWKVGEALGVCPLDGQSTAALAHIVG